MQNESGPHPRNRWNMSVVTDALKAVDWSGRKVLVACSGGVDSMVLLHGLLKIGVKPAVLHVNYQLRGADSEADQQLVEATARSLGLKYVTQRCPVDFTTAGNTNLQAAARAFRRELFVAWTAASPQHVVALGHHADDQVETFFLQLLRGSGTFGLGGMHPERDQLVRPFLHVPKSALLAHAKEQGIVWREDRTNSKSVYARNLFRNELLPALAADFPGLNEEVLFLMQQFRLRQQELTAAVGSMITRWKTSGELNVSDWLELSDEESVAFVHAAGIPVWTVQRFHELAAGAVGNRFLIGDRSIRKSNQELIRMDSHHLDAAWDFKIEEIGILPAVFDKSAVYLDAAQLTGELFMRSWQTGDRIQSVGLKGSQLVSDVLKDAGIPLAERAAIPILTDGTQILWIPGIKVGRTAIARPETSRILKISL